MVFRLNRVAHQDLKPSNGLTSNPRQDILELKLDFGDSWGKYCADNYLQKDTHNQYIQRFVTVVKSFKCIEMKSQKA